MINKTPSRKGSRVIVGLLVLLIACILAFISWYVWQQSNKKSSEAINTFEACVAAGNPIMESYPEQCSADGKTFTKSR